MRDIAFIYFILLGLCNVYAFSELGRIYEGCTAKKLNEQPNELNRRKFLSLGNLNNSLIAIIESAQFLNTFYVYRKLTFWMKIFILKTNIK